MKEALSGIRVLDLTRLLPGPYCTMFLADFGAEVIKVEEPGRGDYMREWPPYINKVGAIHLLVNRNKKSMTLNLKKSEGKEILLELCKQADVLVESFRPGVMDRLGVGYETVRQVNPRLVYCSLSGYGQDGPYRLLPGHDLNYISLAGLLDLCGEPGGDPVIPASQIADLGGGALMALSGILLALLARERQGVGQFIDVAMLDGTVSWMIRPVACYLAGELIKRGEELAAGGLASYMPYETADGKYIAVGALEEKFWENICRKLGREDLVPIQYGDREKQEYIRRELKMIIKTKTRDEWVQEMMFTGDYCVTPVNNVAEMMEDPQVLHREMVVEIDDPVAGRIKQLGVPIKLSGTPGKVARPAPLLGEHTEEMLSKIGLDRTRIDELKEKGVI